MLHVITKTAETFFELADQYDQFLNKIKDSKSPALPNMGYDGPSGLVYLIDPNRKEWRRWTDGRGEIAFLIDQEEIVGVSAVEHSTLSTELGSGGNRCWLLPKYRSNNEVTNYLLESNLQWCKQHDKRGMVLSFNNYNKWIYNTICKKSTGKSSALGKVWSTWWNDCIPLPRQINLQNTSQWAVVKPLDKSTELKRIITHVNKEFGHD